MLANIQRATGYDFIQGPMGSWNFACFGATAGVLVIAMRNRNTEMREIATGALAAGLLGGISEPSLYGIHLRFKRIYPRMLVGCAVGGILTGLLGWSSGGVKTGVFAFTSLLTIPVFTPMWVYVISIAAAFVTAMILIIISDYRTPEQKAEEEADRAQADGRPGAGDRPASPAATAVGRGTGCRSRRRRRRRRHPRADRRRRSPRSRARSSRWTTWTTRCSRPRRSARASGIVPDRRARRRPGGRRAGDRRRDRPRVRHQDR